MTLAMAALVALVAGRARAQTLDLYQGTVIGSPRIVAMGGTVAAVSEDMTATLVTPAAMAFRPPGATGWWDWDFYADTLIASRNTDLTNSGLPAGDDRAVSAGAGGACMYFGKWGIGLSGAGVSYGLPPTAPGAATTTLAVNGSQLTVGRPFVDGRLGVGASLAVGEFSIKQGDTTLFDMTAASFAGGVSLRLPDKPWRAGLFGQLPTMTGSVTNNCSDLTSCNGFVPPTGGKMPWQIGGGFAWRFGPTVWNQPGQTLFRDERALVVTADIALIGPVAGGMSVAGFAGQMPQASGRTADLLARVGAEAELLPGRLRLRAGSYWEPERIEGRGGRIHGTLGAEFKLFGFSFLSRERRVRLALAADVADRYQNIALSLGFWH